MSKKKKDRPLPESFGLPPVGVDSHAHLDMDGADAERIGHILDRARRAGLTGVGNVFLGPAAHARGAALFVDHPEVFFLLGVHPCEAGSCDPETLAALEAAFAADPRLRALGEIGLDYYWDAAPREVQARVFRSQLELAAERGLPVVIHSRQAEADTLAILAEMGFRDRPVLWHCFGGGPELAGKILDQGWFISTPGTVTYAKAEDPRRAVAMIPADRLLLETDSPYLAAEPYRGRTNEPALLVFTALAVAGLTGRDPADVWRTTGDNARRFFGL